MSENNGNKEGRIIAMCPICKKKIRDADGERHIITRYVVAVPRPISPVELNQKTLYDTQISLRKIMCPTCGIEIFLLEDLNKLKERLSGEGGRIVKAPANTKFTQ